MPNDYMQTVQLLERFLCDLHISAICECSSVSDANKTVLECLTESVAYKEHVLDLCERLLLITNAPGLIHVVESLRHCECLATYIHIYATLLCVYTYIYTVLLFSCYRGSDTKL